MKTAFRILIYVSLAFVLVALYRIDYLALPDEVAIPTLVVSFLLLFGGFLGNALAWRATVREAGFAVDTASCMAGVGLTVFAKYVPGKIWVVLGRAAFLAERHGIPLADLSALSLNAQLITLWMGLLLGGAGLFWLDGFAVWGWLVSALWLLLSAGIFSARVHAAAERAAGWLLRRKVGLPRLGFASTLRVLPWFAGYWALWCGGFYAFAQALTHEPLSATVGLGFALASTLGIVVAIAPGGLGVREGLLVAYLGLAGVPLVEATSTSVAARLWFVCGECFVFLIGAAAARVAR